MALLKEKTVLPVNANIEQLQDALADLGPIKVNQVMKNLELNPRGRKAQDMFEIVTAIKNDKVSLNDAVAAYNSVVGAMNARRDRVKDFFTKENIEDIFDDLSDWIVFAINLWNNRKR